jgi:hypothetical protein
MAPLLNAFDAGKSITRTSGVGPLKSRLFWALCNGIEQLGECHLGQKKSRFPGPNPLPLVLVMDPPASQAFLTGPYQSETHR